VENVALCSIYVARYIFPQVFDYKWISAFWNGF
jgi:hypothetical protein